MRNKLMDFVECLAIQKTGRKVFNQYSEKNFPGFFTTKLNLLLYLTQMLQRQPKTILIGEAPGYKGCKITGVPFTSEYIISKSNKFDLFGYAEDILDLLESKNVKLQKESTATTVWNVLEKNNFCPLLWNAYPFYCFENKNKPNRQPGDKELDTGRQFIIELLKLYNIKNIVAVGNIAEKTISKTDFPFYKIPHPAYGNKSNFEIALKDLLDRKLIA